MTTVIHRQGGGYYTMPNRWVDAGYMAASPGSVTQVYLFLSRWADNATHLTAQPMRLISLKCGISEDVARKAVRILEAWGVITRHSQSGRNAANTWTLNELHEEAPEYPKDGKTAQIPRQIAPQQTTTLVESAPPQSRGTYQPKSNNLYIKKETDQKNTDATPNGDVDFEDRFEEFWMAYPVGSVRGKGSKKDARKKWYQIIKDNPERQGEIIDGLERWKNSEMWHVEDGKYICLATTFLNQEKWEDTDVPQRKQKRHRHVV